MNILIIGCGKVGSQLAHELSRLGHGVIIIDRDESNFDNLDSDFDGYSLAGVPIDQDVLRRGGIENCDAVIAVTEDDNVNLVVCQLAKEIFHVPRVLARVFDPVQETIFSEFGLNNVCPTRLTVASIMSTLAVGKILPQPHLRTSTYTFTQVPVPKKLIGRRTDEYLLTDNEMIFGVVRADLTFVPANGRTLPLSAGDSVVLATKID